MNDNRNSSSSNIPDDDFTSPFIEDMSRPSDAARSGANSAGRTGRRSSRRESSRGGKRLQGRSGSSGSSGRETAGSGPAETRGWRTTSESEEVPDWSSILDTGDQKRSGSGAGRDSGRSSERDTGRNSDRESDRDAGRSSDRESGRSSERDTGRGSGRDRGGRRPDGETPDGYVPRERTHGRKDRKNGKSGKTVALVSVAILTVCYAAILVYLLFFPRSTVSLLENRTLEQFPTFTMSSYFSGDFTADIATWFDDTVPNRDTLKNMSYSISSLFGLTSDTNTITLVNVDITANDVGNDLNEEEENEIYDSNGNVVRILKAAEPAGIQTEDDVEAEEEEVEEEAQTDYTAQEAEFDFSNGLMIVYQDGHWKCLSLFGGGSGDNYAEGINALQAAVGDHVNIYSMPAPLSSQFYIPSNASEYSNDQSECIENVHAKLDDGVTKINLCPVLSKHTDEDIYLRTDAHWAPLGAYYAARTLAEAADVPFADISEYTPDSFDGYVGTMYGYTKDTRLLNDPETFHYYWPSNSYRTFFYDTAFNYEHEGDLIQPAHESYVMFMGADNITVKVSTDVDNGRKLLVVKDSYGNAEIPFYTSSFEDIYVVDVRYCEFNLINFIEDMDITDVVFTTSTFAMVGTNSKYVPTLMTQAAGAHVVDYAPDVTGADTEEAEEP